MPDSQEAFELALAESRHAELRFWIDGWMVPPPSSVHQIHMHFVFDDGCRATIEMDVTHGAEQPSEDVEVEQVGFFRDAWFRICAAWACLRGEE